MSLSSAATSLTSEQTTNTIDTPFAKTLDERTIRTPAQNEVDRMLVHLAERLHRDNVRYCQWKGEPTHHQMPKVNAGSGDIDLLVSRREVDRFSRLLQEQGFKRAVSGRSPVPGMESFLGFDARTGRLVHIHAHYRLVLGRATATHYHLPIEDDVLASLVHTSLFKTPTPALELALFVIHQTLRHRTRSLLSEADEQALRLMQPRLARLERAATLSDAATALQSLVPDIDADCFWRCRNSLFPDTTAPQRQFARQKLAHRLSAYARSPRASDRASRAGEFAMRALRIRTHATGSGNKILASGGSMIALAGTDGSGKSTCATALAQWLGDELKVRRAHFGRPPKTLFTKFVGLLLRVAYAIERKWPGKNSKSVVDHAILARAYCAARDRFRLYQAARRFVADGGIVIGERFPLQDDILLVGPSSAQGIVTHLNSALARMLRRGEESFYARMHKPGLVIRLDVDPETAVKRKTNEPSDYVYKRAVGQRAVASANGKDNVVDATRPLREVLADLRRRTWESL